MSQSSPSPVILSQRILGGLIVLNRVAGVLILTMLLLSLIAPHWLFGALGVPEAGQTPALRLGMRLIMVIGVAGTVASNRALTKLHAIVASVSSGDPFVAVNAVRLMEIAWAMLGLEVLHLCVGLVEASISSAGTPLDLNWRFSITPWLSIMLLFVLARVFADGARMRDDLDGTV